MNTLTLSDAYLLSVYLLSFCASFFLAAAVLGVLYFLFSIDNDFKEDDDLLFYGFY